MMGPKGVQLVIKMRRVDNYKKGRDEESGDTATSGHNLPHVALVIALGKRRPLSLPTSADTKEEVHPNKRT